MKDEVDIYDIQQKLIAGFGINSFGSYEAVWDMLRDIRLLKYVRRNQLSGINKRYEKTCSDIKIDRLIELGLLKKTENDILIFIIFFAADFVGAFPTTDLKESLNPLKDS